MRICRTMRAFCLKHESVANVAIVIAMGLVGSTIWGVLAFYPQLLSWLNENIVLHGSLALLALGFNVLAMYGTLCLGFSRHTPEHKRFEHTYRSRRNSSVFPEASTWVSGLGKNPLKA